MDTGLAAAELTVMEPLYAPDARPEGLTDMVRSDGVVALEGVTDSQLPPEAAA